MTENRAPFCALPAERVLGQNADALWVRDAFPVSAGNGLAIPKGHIGFFLRNKSAGARRTVGVTGGLASCRC